jgi:hypothetical protein
MACKHLISTGLLIFGSLFSACSSSEGKKGSAPAPSTTVNPNQKPTPTPTISPSPTPSPVPTPSPTGSPVPAGQTMPVAGMIGDWQSTFSDPNYFGNVTYTFRADGHVLMSLLIYGKGKTEIMAERHEFKAKFFLRDRKIELEPIKGPCAARSAKPLLTYFFSENDPNLFYLQEGASSPYLRLSKIKGGLLQDVHTVPTLNAYDVKNGCFMDGRLNQFAPVEG